MFVGVARKLWKQTFADIFFVDWEQSRGSEGARPDKAQRDALSVSVWRKLMVVNVFHELQTLRGVEIHVTVFVLVVLLEAAGLKNLATAQPDASDLDPQAGT